MIDLDDGRRLVYASGLEHPDHTDDDLLDSLIVSIYAVEKRGNDWFLYYDWCGTTLHSDGTDTDFDCQGQTRIHVAYNPKENLTDQVLDDIRRSARYEFVDFSERG